MKNTLYEVCDRITRDDWIGLLGRDPKLNERGGLHCFLPSLGHCSGRVKAKWTGEKRAPRKGEWYLSGAIVEAYRAPNDLSTPYHLAKLVLTETVIVVREVVR